MKTLLVFGEKTFKITVPDESKITFGPWSPPKGERTTMMSDAALRGTLRIYDKDKNVIAVFSGVSGYRDAALNYSEQVAKEEGAVIWKSDQEGYQREEKVKRKEEWIKQLPPVRNGKRKVADDF